MVTGYIFMKRGRRKIQFIEFWRIGQTERKIVTSQHWRKEVNRKKRTKEKREMNIQKIKERWEESCIKDGHANKREKLQKWWGNEESRKKIGREKTGEKNGSLFCLRIFPKPHLRPTEDSSRWASPFQGAPNNKLRNPINRKRVGEENWTSWFSSNKPPTVFSTCIGNYS